MGKKLGMVLGAVAFTCSVATAETGREESKRSLRHWARGLPLIGALWAPTWKDAGKKVGRYAVQAGAGVVAHRLIPACAGEKAARGCCKSKKPSSSASSSEADPLGRESAAVRFGILTSGHLAVEKATDDLLGEVGATHRKSSGWLHALSQLMHGAILLGVHDQTWLKLKCSSSLATTAWRSTVLHLLAGWGHHTVEYVLAYLWERHQAAEAEAAERGSDRRYSPQNEDR